MTDYEHIQAVKRANEARLLAIPGVHSVGIGPKITNGQRTGEMAIVVWLPKKKPVEAIPPDQLVPKEIDGVPVDVVENDVPDLHRSNDATHPKTEDGSTYDPLLGGCRIQVTWDVDDAMYVESGTLGCFGITNGTKPGIPQGMVVGVTCHHVLYTDSPTSGIGRKVGQPTPQDSSRCCSDIVGRALLGNPNPDTAVFALKPELQYRVEVTEFGPITGTHEVDASEIPLFGPDYIVRKRGFRTGLTEGKIVSVDHSGTMEDSHGNQVPYSNALAIISTGTVPLGKPPFSMKGDSGAAIVNLQGEVVGILFSGSPLSTLAAHIENVELILGIQLATTQQAGVVKQVPKVAGDPIFAFAAMAQAEAGAAAPTFARAYEEVVQTAAGKELLHAVRRHENEVRSLIDTNRRIAAAWRRNGGPQILNGIFRAIRLPDQRLPSEVAGRSLMERLTAIQRALARYGSPALSSDLARYVPQLAALGGLTFDQLLATLRSGQAA
jgi:hypothetical protein